MSFVPAVPLACFFIFFILGKLGFIWHLLYFLLSWWVKLSGSLGCDSLEQSLGVWIHHVYACTRVGEASLVKGDTSVIAVVNGLDLVS